MKYKTKLNRVRLTPDDKLQIYDHFAEKLAASYFFYSDGNTMWTNPKYEVTKFNNDAVFKKDMDLLLSTLGLVSLLNDFILENENVA